MMMTTTTLMVMVTLLDIIHPERMEMMIQIKEDLKLLMFDLSDPTSK